MKLKADNAKLNYRVEHLRRAYDHQINDKSQEEEIAKLRAENAKLNYRVEHLKKAVDEKEKQ